MIYLRSMTFNLVFYLWTVLIFVLHVPALAGPHQLGVAWQRRWANHVGWLMHRLAGITYEIRGAQHLPKTGCVVAAKHQSAWDTLIWHAIVDDPAMVMKAELLKIPIYGAWCRKSRMIVIDRGGGGST